MRMKDLHIISCAVAVFLLGGCTKEVDNGQASVKIRSEHIIFTPSLQPINSSVATRANAGKLIIEREDWPLTGQEKATRAAPISSLSGDVGVVGYTTTSSTTTLFSSLNDKSFTFDSGALTASSSPVPWRDISTTDQLDVYAYAPYDFIDHGGAPVNPTISTEGTAPTIIYAVPSDVASQKDLIVAKASVLNASYGTSIDLNFAHVLTAIRFKVGFACYVKSISVQNVYGAGTYNFTSWTPTGSQDATYTLNVDNDKTTLYEAEETVTDGANTLMLIPQTTDNASAQVVLTYAETSGGPDKTLTASIQDHTWTAGKRITYIINKDETVEYIYFDVAADSVRIVNGTYAGAVFDSDGTTKIAVTGSHLKEDGITPNKYYVYQTSSVGQRTAISWAGTAGKSTPSGLPSESYSTYVYGGKTWQEYITGTDFNEREAASGGTDIRDLVYAGWNSLATARGIVAVNDNYVRIDGNMDVDITIDNLYITYPSSTSNYPDKDTMTEGKNPYNFTGQTMGSINIGPGNPYFNDRYKNGVYYSGGAANRNIYNKKNRYERVNLRLKGDNRVQNVLYFGHPNNQTGPDRAFLNITSADGDGSPNGTMTVYFNNGDDLRAHAAIGCCYTAVSPPCNSLRFSGGTVFVGGSKSNSFEGVLGGGNGHTAEITFNDGCVVTSVASNNAAAIGGGGGLDAAGSDATITINGGKVYAYQKGTYYSVGERQYGSNATVAIGGGSSFSGKAGVATITISGGEVYAQSIGGTAIGGGSHLKNRIDAVLRPGGDAFITITGGKVTAKSISGTIRETSFTAGNSIGGGSGGKDANGGNAGTSVNPMIISGGTVLAGSIGGGSIILTPEEIAAGSTSRKIGSANIQISGTAIVQGQFIMQAPDASTSPSFTMTGGTLQPNKADKDFEYVQPNGGAVWIDGGSFTMSGGTIKDFSVAYDSVGDEGGLGGAVYMQSTIRASSFNMSNGTIRSCSATSASSSNGLGGAVYMSGGTFSMSGGTIGGGAAAGNQATNGGGAVYLDGGTFNMTGGAISYNRSTASSGGGVFIEGGSFNMNSSSASIDHNYAFVNGGGVNVVSLSDAVSVGITTGSITNNTAEHYGGGVCVIPSGSIAANVIYGTDGSDNTTTPAITDNSAGLAGGGLYAEGSYANVTLYSGKIKDNYVSATVPNQDVANEEGSVTLYNTDVTKVTITFNVNGGSLSSGSLTQNVAKGTNSLLVAPTVTRINYTLTEWNTAADGSGVSFANGNNTCSLTGDVTLYAIWTPAS